MIDPFAVPGILPGMENGSGEERQNQMNATNNVAINVATNEADSELDEIDNDSVTSEETLELQDNSSSAPAALDSSREQRAQSAVQDNSPDREDSNNMDISEEAPSLESLIEKGYEEDEVAQDILAAKRKELRRLPQHIMAKGIKLAMGDLVIRENQLWISDQLYILNYKPLRLRIMELHHLTTVAGHPGSKGMY